MKEILNKLSTVLMLLAIVAALFTLAMGTKHPNPWWIYSGFSLITFILLAILNALTGDSDVDKLARLRLDQERLELGLIDEDEFVGTHGEIYALKEEQEDELNIPNNLVLKLLFIFLVLAIGVIIGLVNLIN